MGISSEIPKNFLRDFEFGSQLDLFKNLNEITYDFLYILMNISMRSQRGIEVSPRELLGKSYLDELLDQSDDDEAGVGTETLVI